MMSKFLCYVIFACCTLACSFAQIILKKSADKEYTGIKIFLNSGTIIGYGVNLSVTLVVVLLYRYIEISVAVMLDSLGYVFIAALSRVLLKEKINKKRIFGIALILSGIVVYAILGG